MSDAPNSMHNLETRLYIELTPDELSRQKLSKIVENIKPHVKGRFIDSSKWHVTIMHFGIARHVYTELKKALPDLNEPVFLNALEKYIRAFKQTSAPPIQLDLADYELLGGRNNVLAVRLELLTRSDKPI